MDKHSRPDSADSPERLPEPVVLTPEETKQIAAGLAAAVAGVLGHCCSTCGRGTVFQAAE